jgi:uncharacterized protein with PQ loop repeat
MIRSAIAEFLSLKMLVALSAGLWLWVIYGVAEDDWVTFSPIRSVQRSRSPC